jgi:hypothetical protein
MTLCHLHLLSMQHSSRSLTSSICLTITRHYSRMWLKQETLRPVDAFHPSRGCVIAGNTATILSRPFQSDTR